MHRKEKDPRQKRKGQGKGKGGGEKGEKGKRNGIKKF